MSSSACSSRSARSSKKAKRKRAKAAKAKKPRAPAQFSSAHDAGRELSLHGYEAEGPIGAGAFSTVLRARIAETGVQVAVKSFDNVKCRKHASMALARDAELSVLHLRACPPVACE